MQRSEGLTRGDCSISRICRCSSAIKIALDDCVDLTVESSCSVDHVFEYLATRHFLGCDALSSFCC